MNERHERLRKELDSLIYLARTLATRVCNRGDLVKLQALEERVQKADARFARRRFLLDEMGRAAGTPAYAALSAAYAEYIEE